MLIVAIALFIFGLCLGSFVNALVWRVHEQSGAKASKDLSILLGRSMCPRCKHELNAKDLTPLFSWLILMGKCRYCQKPISWQYPIVELVMGIVFVLSYIFWPASLDENGQLMLLGAWLISSVGLLALLVYDYKWMLLPNRILYPTAVVAMGGRLGYILIFSSDKLHDLLNLMLALMCASGIFLLLFVASRGRWIGFGDVRLGLITGSVLARPSMVLLMIFLASVLGTLFALPELVSGRQKMAGKIPFGPFLITATFIVLIVGSAFLSWYENLII